MIEHLIGLLDQLDGDPDLEDGADSEPSIGRHASWGTKDDLEDDMADYEPWLGRTEELSISGSALLSTGYGAEGTGVIVEPVRWLRNRRR